MENVLLFSTPHIVSHFAYQHLTTAPSLTNLCRITCIEVWQEVLHVRGELRVLMTPGWRRFLDWPLKCHIKAFYKKSGGRTIHTLASGGPTFEKDNVHLEHLSAELVS